MIPVEVPPCLPGVACRVLGHYLGRCGLDPASFEGDFSWMFPKDGPRHGPEDYRAMPPEDEAFYREHVAAAVAFWKGRAAGRW